MDLGLDGKRAVVAASSSGLGHAVALELAQEGARVALCSRDRARIDRSVETIRAAVSTRGGAVPDLLGVTADLCRAGEPQRFVEEAVARFGGVDVVVANNGGPPPGPAIGLSDEAWEAGFQGTFLSSKRLVEAALPGMRERGWGRVIFVTSISVKQPIEGLAISTAMRSAVVGYAKMLSDDVAAEGVTVNCVAPGSTLTARLESILGERARSRGASPAELRAELESRIPARRFGRPDEFAAAVAFLASERASYITGTVLAVDGGVVRSLT